MPVQLSEQETTKSKFFKGGRPMLVKKDPLNLTGKVAVITGGSSGIGLGVVELLSAYGAKVAMVDVSPKGEIFSFVMKDVSSFN